MVQPSARNPRAIKAYEKVGFKRLELPIEAARELWGPNDYERQRVHGHFPEPGGLLPAGGDTNGGSIFWITDGPPGEWSLVLYDWRGGYDYESST